MSATARPLVSPTRVSLARMLASGIRLVVGFWMLCALIGAVVLRSVIGTGDSELAHESVLYLARNAAAWFPLIVSAVLVFSLTTSLVIAGATRRVVARSSVLAMLILAVANTAVFVLLLAAEQVTYAVTGAGRFVLTPVVGLAEPGDLLLVAARAFILFAAGGMSGLLLSACSYRWRRNWKAAVGIILSFAPVIVALLWDPTASASSGSGLWAGIGAGAVVVLIAAAGIAFDSILRGTPLRKPRFSK
ncbi:hypothetical protein [Lysinibacter cavernae]|uniref:Uncharacterized protein n=1 Tax=Lysinibacter cavernae TaxID=1640652 RepID=A0A7X5R103_9MICO|nr:hypothetical protein [Lysinibacter cavernae]NIH53629.1 hypothetical protein [Lysinibacter cavernae]